MPLLARLALLAGILLAQSATAQLPVVYGEPALAVQAVAPRLRTPAAKGLGTRVQLPDIAESAEARVLAANLRGGGPKTQQRRVIIGVVRSTDGAVPVPSGAQMAWTAVQGGFVARVSVASPGAESLRLAIELAGAPAELEMVFFGSADPARLEGPIRAGEVRDRTAAWWGPITEGDTQTVEFFVPSGFDLRRLPLRVTRASHLLTTPSSSFTKRLQDIGKSGSCNVDIPCSRLNGNGAFRDAAASVAQMVFNDAGFTAMCSGTLLNDTDPASQLPYFFSANHCFENDTAPYKTPAQMQAVANSLTTIWGFEASACVNGRGNGTALPTWTQRAGGAAVLYNDTQTDALLLKLNDAAPAGAFYSGWDPNPISAGTPVISIHHPQGDLKKVTEGSVQRFSAPGVGGASQPFIEVLWSRGTTEGGSSGGGLWSAAGSQYLLRGGLWGGSALCTNLAGADFFSRFDVASPSIAQYLSASGGSVDYTDLWWNPGESGWGLNLIQHPSRVIFGVWYTYGADGKRTWFVMPGGSWTAANTFTGSLYATTGPNLAQPFDASKVSVQPVGTATLTFSDADNGTFAYSVNGVAGAKAIARQPF